MPVPFHEAKAEFFRMPGRLVARMRALLPVRADFAAMTRAPRRDLLAGLTVAIVALPLAL
ncbi:hypothetical protein G3M53_02050, partial [Streptomyces sp. SID7982]|nr:hypothetical protein [Streptomyces sp. SID7982]